MNKREMVRTLKAAERRADPLVDRQCALGERIHAIRTKAAEKVAGWKAGDMFAMKTSGWRRRFFVVQRVSAYVWRNETTGADCAVVTVWALARQKNGKALASCSRYSRGFSLSEMRAAVRVEHKEGPSNE